MIRRFAIRAGAALAALWPAAGMADDNLVTTLTNNYGTPGTLLDMPTAEMAPVGQLAATVSHFDGTTKTTLTFQVTERLSTSFRYSAIRGLVINRPPPNPPFVSSAFYDRSFDLRFRLLDEGMYRPAVAIGLQDFIGTGLFGAEYIVATKSIGERLRFSGGIGWGRLGSYASFGSTGSRPTSLLGEGGIPTYDRWFRGDVAAFAGLSYQATDKLNLKVEYSSDAYDREVTDGITTRRTPWNFGASYKLNDALALSTYYLQGEELGVNLTFSLNARKPAVNGGTEKAPVPVAVRAAGAAADLGWTANGSTQSSIRQTIASSLKTEGMALHALELNATDAHVVIRNNRFDMRSQAVGRTARVLTRTLPASIETLTISQSYEGVPTSSVTFRRSDLERLENAPASEILKVATFSDAVASGAQMTPVPDAYPRFDWGVGPFVRLSVFDPDNPVRGSGGIEFNGQFRFAPGWVASGAVQYKLVGNLDNVSLPGASGLPRVRSNVAFYSREEDPTIEHLTVAKYFRPAKDFYGRVTAGYLERMYAGASAELLWKPVDSRLALGAELNYVAPRDFDQLFGIRTRNTTGGRIPELNGYVSAYYDFGNGFHAQLDVGRYLAGDWGATVSLDREFANGWRVGAFATKTDVSSATFGEGSFDKGIRISIPLSYATGKPTQRRTDTVIRSLSRDGGARLEVDGRLYEAVRNTHQPEMAESWGKFWR